MGNSILKGQGKVSAIPPLLDETQIFTLWTIADVRELWKRFQNQIYGFALVEAQFESIISFKENVAKHIKLEELFSILDNDHDGRIDGLELLGGLTLCCQASFEEKARFCFELFDFNLNACMSKKELIIMMMSSVCGLNILTGGGEELEPDLEVFEEMADDAIKRADLNSDGQISFEEFLYWARTNRELMAGLETLNKISSDAKEDIDTEDSAPETDDGVLSEDSEAEGKQSPRSRLKRLKGSAQSDNKSGGVAGLLIPVQGDEAQSSSQWLGQICEPTNFKIKKRDIDVPDTNLELAWVYGYRAQNCRNNLRYVGPAEAEPHMVVFYTAALGVVYDLQKRTQRFYMGHSDQVTCLAMHPSQKIVATADVKANIHIWNTDYSSSGTFAALSIIKGIVRHGFQHLAFSPLGDRIVAVGLDPDHTVTIYDISTGAIISSAKGLVSPNTVTDIAYSNSGTEIAMVGKNQVKFFRGANSNKRALESHIGKIGSSGKRQTFFCVTYFKDDAIVGCASGELYRFRDGQCVEIVQAHGAKEPVLCLFYNRVDGTLLSGGKDALIKTWDFTLKEVGTAIDLSEDVDGDGKADNGSLDSAIVSVQQVGDRILIGTKGSDVFEAKLPPTPAEHHLLSRMVWGHSSGELWGLAMHPLRDEFATCGGDKTVRIWSIRTHEQVNMRITPEDARSLCYSPSGEVLCIGMTDGSVALMEAASSALRVYSTWKHCDRAITDIKFAPNGKFVAIASADTNIYLYKSEDGKAFVRQAVCKGHSGAISHIDFSANSQFLQSNATDYSLLFWDTKGNQVKASSSMRDTLWDTSTCVLAWHMQGVWKPGADYSDINACMALPDIGDIVTGDDFHRVNLYKYPAVQQGALFQSYVGHASHVTNVRFSANRRHVVSLGGSDRTILLWRHNLEEAESDAEVNGNSSSASSNDEGHLAAAVKNEIADVGPRSIEQEAANLGWTTQEMKDFVAHHKRKQMGSDRLKPAVAGKSVLEAGPSHGDESTAPVVRPWRSAIAEPTQWTASQGCTDVDLTLQWVHGFRSYDCRNNVLYAAAGHVVYNTAALAVVHNKAAGKQQFLQGAHLDEIVGIAGHPAGQIFATGEAGRAPSILIWNSKDMNVLSKIEGAHSNGVPLMAFNSRGNILASVGLDSDSSLCLHDWAKSIQILRTATDKGKVLCVCFLANDTISAAADGASAVDIVVTGGEKHLMFWWAQGQNVQSQRALWGEERLQTVMCVASSNSGVCVTGSSRGELLIWKDFKVAMNVKSASKVSLAEVNPSASHQVHPEYPHSNAIHAIWAIRGTVSLVQGLQDCLEGYHQSSRYITGDKDGVICIWRLVEGASGGLSLVLMKSFSTAQLFPKSTGVGVRSVCERDGILLIGTKGNEIYEVPESSLPFLITKNNSLATLPPTVAPSASALSELRVTGQRLSSGHSVGEVWGLAMHPYLPVFFTTGDDNTVKCWSLTTNRMLSYCVLPDKSRAVSINADGIDFGFVLNSGKVWVGQSERMLNPHNKMSFKGAVDPQLDGLEIMLHADRSDKTSEFTTSTRRSSLSEAVSCNIEFRELGCDPVSGGPNKWCQVLKYSFEGSLLAAGSDDHHIYVYSVAKDYAWLYTLSEHSSFVTHLDFGLLLLPPTTTTSRTETATELVGTTVTVTERYDQDARKIIVRSVEQQFRAKLGDDQAPVVSSAPIVSEREKEVTPELICIQSTGDGYDLLFWRGDGSKIASSSAMKDAWWASFSCPLGWSVQGIWPAETEEGVEINAVARSHTWDKVPVLATVDNFGRLRLYNYPCVVPGASDKCYRGHASNVANVAFSYDDAYCVTTGGDDKGVFVWTTDIQDEIRERAAFAAASGGVAEDSDLDADQPEEDDYTVVKMVPTAGDEAGAIKPWKGAIREPSDWKEPADLGQVPDANLELKFVYGYRGWDCRNNLSFADSRFEVVYHIAGVGVVFNSQEHKQIHNTEHDDDILCLAVHPEGHTVATGEIGKLPKIVLWDANTGVTIRVIMYHKKGVANVAFSQDGNLLVSTGLDEERTVVVHNVKTGAVLGRGKAGKGIDVYSVTVGGCDMFVTGGKNHVKFWELPKPNSPGGELSSKAGIYNIKAVKARSVVATSFLGADAVTGMSDGTLLLWKDRSNTKFCQAHNGSVTAMCSVSESGKGGGNIDSRENGPRIVTGGKDGQVHVWDIQLNKVWSLNMLETRPTSACAQIQALATKENRLLIGTKASEIYEVNMLNGAEAYRLVQGHFSERAEVWGLATHPSMHKFITCGDDMTVRIWDSRTMQQTDVVNIGVKARAVAFHPDGSQVAVATFEGKVIILSSNLQTVVTTITVASAWIQAMSFSSDGSLLGVGSHNDVIYLLETKSYSCRFQFKGHHSFITALDFSADATKLQSVSGDYELLFWDCVTGKQILSATLLRDVRWSTFTCTLGWPVQGIWPVGADGTDVNAVDKSPDGRYLVSGDDFRKVKLFRYPCPKEKSAFRECKGHAEHVTNVKFSFDGKYVISVGGLDKAVLQFEVKQLFANGKK